MNKIIFLCLGFLFLTSCVSRKKLTYIQRDENPEQYIQLQRSKYKVQQNDILTIRVRSFDQSTSDIFNTMPSNANVAQGGDVQAYLNGYSVDPEGNIDMPVIGKVYVLYQNIDEIKATVQERLNKYFKKEVVYVSVQLAGVRFSIIGDINGPGKYVIYQNQVNIFEAIAAAGDISLVGNREEVQIVRQNPKGIEIIEINLLEDDILASPYFFIQPNDIINIKPLPAKSLGVGTTGIATVSTILSIVSSTLLLFITVRNLNAN